MKHIVLTLTLSLLMNLTALAQLSCGTENLTAEQELQRRNFVDSLHTARASNQTTEDGIQYIAVKMHLFGNTDGSGFPDHNDINNGLAMLNSEFRNLNVKFYFSGSALHHYANTAFNTGTQSPEADWNYYAENIANDAINCYVQEIVWAGGSIVGGVSPLDPGELFSNRLYITNFNFNDGKTTVHEFAHYFGLQHTFNGSWFEDLTQRELVTRNFNEVLPRLSANCDATGDFVCDTPSDPYPVEPSTSCVYSSTLTDVNGDLFSPLTDNYMDYRYCTPYSFTPGQIQRMQDSGVITNGGGVDFTFNAPETVQPAPADLQVVSENNTFQILTWTHDSLLETGYIIEKANTPEGPFIAIGGVAENVMTFSNLGLDPVVPSYFRVKPSNTKAIYSLVTEPIFLTFPCGNAIGQSCNGSEADWIIDSFSINDGTQALLSNSGTGCEPGGFGNYYNTQAAQIMPGQTVQFQIQAAQDSEGNSFEIVARIYADWNQNLLFEETELLYTEAAPQFHEIFGNLSIPATIAPGDYRLRVLLSAYSLIDGPCSANFGEIEDYKVSVIPLGTESFQAVFRDMAIAPNPVTSMLTITSSAVIDKVIITDMTGKRIIEESVDTKHIKLADLASGMYIVTASSGEFSQSKKIIKE
jgi:GEVED domain/Secretion system C-terminal sorting domain/Pregnancy-associated plasma protein-A